MLLMNMLKKLCVSETDNLQLIFTGLVEIAYFLPDTLVEIIYCGKPVNFLITSIENEDCKEAVYQVTNITEINIDVTLKLLLNKFLTDTYLFRNSIPNLQKPQKIKYPIQISAGSMMKLKP